MNSGALVGSLLRTAVMSALAMIIASCSPSEAPPDQRPTDVDQRALPNPDERAATVRDLGLPDEKAVLEAGYRKTKDGTDDGVRTMAFQRDGPINSVLFLRFKGESAAGFAFLARTNGAKSADDMLAPLHPFKGRGPIEMAMVKRYVNLMQECTETKFELLPGLQCASVCKEQKRGHVDIRCVVGEAPRSGDRPASESTPAPVVEDPDKAAAATCLREVLEEVAWSQRNRWQMYHVAQRFGGSDDVRFGIVTEASIAYQARAHFAGHETAQQEMIQLIRQKCEQLPALREAALPGILQRRARDLKTDAITANTPEAFHAAALAFRELHERVPSSPLAAGAKEDQADMEERAAKLLAKRQAP
jgi:hypothetical protein